MQAPFKAQSMSIEAQTFLYACAFWAVAADEKLRGAEQAWLVEQFGASRAADSLNTFMPMERDAFLAAFDEAATALPEADRACIFPQLEAWLLTCAQADGDEADTERQAIARVLSRLDIPAKRVKESDLTVRPAVTADRAVPLLSEPIALEGHTSELTCVAWTDHGLYSGSEDGTIRAWNLLSSDSQVLHSTDSAILTLRVEAEGPLFCGDRQGRVAAIDLVTRKTRWSIDHPCPGGITAVDISPDGTVLYAATNIGVVLVLQSASGKLSRDFGDQRRGAINALAVSPDGKRVAVGGDDHQIHLYDTEMPDECQSCSGHSDGVLSLDFSPDNRYLLSSGRDNAVLLWDTRDGTIARRFKGHSFTVPSAVLSPDAMQLASGSWDHTLRVWDTVSRRALIKFDVGNTRISGVAYSRDGRNIALACSDRTLRIIPLPPESANDTP